MSCMVISCNIDLLQFWVEVFACFQGRAQHSSLWVDFYVFLRPAEDFSFMLTEGMQQLGKYWSGGCSGMPETGDERRTPIYKLSINWD